ncbi:MAG: RNA polymerase sigma factor [Bacteroidota bacterium]
MHEELIRLCLKNDRKAQKEVYENLFGRMHAVCLRYLKDPDDALEVLNNGFLSVFTNIKQYGFKGSFEGWVKRIMINKSLDHLRANKRFSTTDAVDDEYAFRHVSVDNEAWSNLGLEVLDGMIAQLPPMSRSVFNLYVIDGYSHHEIANILSINPGTSRWHLSYARQSLQKMVKKTLHSSYA